MASLAESAENFFKTYAELIASGKNAENALTEEDFQTQLHALCKKIVSYRLPGCIAFGIPGVPPQQDKSPELAAQQVIAMLNNCYKLGMSIGLTNKSCKVQVLFDQGGYGACILDVTYGWTPREKSDLKPWDVRAFYGYRKLATGEEGWEMCYLDDEFTKLMENLGPKAYEGIELAE
jgi:hypothetical protein